MTWTHEYTWTLAATPETVFAAFTDAAVLREWFAECADVAPQVGGAYAFWGRHTLDTREPAQATQRLTTWEPPTQLGYSWTILGIPSTVHFTLQEQRAPAAAGTAATPPDWSGARTTLTLRHAVHGTLPVPRQREMIDDHWRLAIGNLAAHLAGGEGLALPDYTHAEPQVQIMMRIAAPRAAVFRALTTAELVNQWLGATAAVVEPWVGGRFELGWQYTIDGREVVGGPTRVLDLVDQVSLELDWPDWRGDESVTGQTIQFVLEDAGDDTVLHFSHRGFERTVDLSDFPFGWQWFLSELRNLVQPSPEG